MHSPFFTFENILGNLLKFVSNLFELTETSKNSFYRLRTLLIFSVWIFGSTIIGLFLKLTANFSSFCKLGYDFDDLIILAGTDFSDKPLTFTVSFSVSFTVSFTDLADSSLRVFYFGFSSFFIFKGAFFVSL